MKRYVMESLIKWKNKKNRMPLILSGVRQVGKTWLMKEFGKLNFKNTAYINFDSNPRMKELFESSLETKTLINGIQLETGIKIVPEETLLIFDEIQEVPRALTSLKYFNENNPELYIIAAGSLLGVALHQGTSFPVGNAEFLNIHPLSFFEYLEAMGETGLVETLKSEDYKLAEVFKSKYMECLKNYYFIGGMPGVVSEFAENRDYDGAREVQMNILRAYENDFSKHMAPETAVRTNMLWNSIPSQLSKINHKFIYGVIKEGARAKDYEMSIAWLKDCGMVSRVAKVKKPEIPLKVYEDISAFKLYICDVGLLSAMCGLRKQTLLEGARVYSEFKGALTEQYVLQQLIACGIDGIYYWAPVGAKAEIDFIIQTGLIIVPVEAKAEQNLHAKSLKSYIEKYKPAAAVRTSMAGFRKDGDIINLPLFMIQQIEQIVNKLQK
ncbi:MAG: ATP-binding protein [Candidatus Goldbacteria bacterium]|nr:ATP-binding protein [Candidatus Goldiibacteriota bacterium]